MGHVFVSHSSSDATLAKEVVGFLEHRGIPCWYAARDVDLGDDFSSQIIRAIDRSDQVVVLVSAAANESPHVRRELERAVASRRPIVPVRIGGVVASESLSYFLSGAQWIDLGAGPHELTLQRVVNVLTGGPAQLDKRPPVPFHQILSTSTSDVGIKIRHPLATMAIVCSSTLVLAPLGVLFGLIYLSARGRPPEGRLVAGYAVFIGLVVIAVAVGVAIVVLRVS